MAGGKMKATIGWNSSNTSATNESGLTGLPGGLRFEDGSYGMIGAMSFWWSATELETDNAWSRDIEAAGTEVVGTFFLKTNGFSVRCIRD